MMVLVDGVVTRPLNDVRVDVTKGKHVTNGHPSGKTRRDQEYQDGKVMDGKGSCYRRRYVVVAVDPRHATS
jgi:hypothetical protein